MMYNLILVYILTIIAIVLTYIIYLNIDNNLNRLFRLNKNELLYSILEKFKVIKASIISILLLSIPIYFINSGYKICLFIIIYCLILSTYFDLNWIRKNIK